MNRGSQAQRTSNPTPISSFNEAPIHESGKSSVPTTPYRAPLSFNEAPIHESGKCRCVARRLAAWSGFNEAPIHESGKFDAFVQDHPSPEVASMRPRFMNRGSATVHFTGAQAIELQ